MQVGVPGQGTGASEDAPHSPPKLGLPCDGRKKTAVAAVVRLEPRDANLGHVFCVTGVLCRKRFYSSSSILQWLLQWALCCPRLRLCVADADSFRALRLAGAKAQHQLPQLHTPPATFVAKLQNPTFSPFPQIEMCYVKPALKTTHGGAVMVGCHRNSLTA